MDGPKQGDRARANSRLYLVEIGKSFPLLSEVLRLLRGAPYDVCRCSSIHELLSQQRSCTPACVVLAVEALGPEGLDLQELIASKSDLPIILVTSSTTAQEVVLAMKHGAADIVYEGLDRQQFLSSVDKALAAQQLRAASRKMRAEFQQRCASLTHKEHEVYEMLVAGVPSEAICARLGLADRTLKHHRSRIMEKLGFRSMVQFVRAVESLKH